ncbi:MAG: glycosyltransferase [Rhodobacterales bacterium]|nr:glycosyltransferase [Rhodobacterales bacterium]
MRILIELNCDPSDLTLVAAIARRRGTHEMLVLINSSDRTLIGAARVALHNLIPPNAIRIWAAPKALTGEVSPEIDVSAAADIREVVIASLEADILLSIQRKDKNRYPAPASHPACILLDASTYSAHPDLDAAADAIIGDCMNAADAAAPKEPPVSEERPLLAFVSPLPPARSGIAEYAVQLLQPLSRHYQIHLITDQDQVSDPSLFKTFPIHSPGWLKANAGRFDRIIYHFGNSPIHRYMYDLLPIVPGIVVLHDFFLLDGQNGFLSKEVRRETIMRQHGITALIDAPQLEAASPGIEPFPGNLGVLQNATGIIVHGEESCRLAEQWYGPGTARTWHRIPHLRPFAEVSAERRRAARARLGFSADDIVICSFGNLGKTKLNLEMLRALTQSRLASDRRVQLIFFGEAEEEYKASVLKAAKKLPAAQFRIRGWADTRTYEDHLLAADISVQLRSQSRGETSGAVLDCMNYGLPTIVNAHGSMRDLDPDAVFRVDEPLSKRALAHALETLVNDADLRSRLAVRAREVIVEMHDPETCAEAYQQAIEQSVRSWHQQLAHLPVRLAQTSMNETHRLGLAKSLAVNFPPSPRRPVLFVDVSKVAAQDVHTGIQRVVRSIVNAFFKRRDLPHFVLPVRLADTGEFMQALRFAERIAGLPIGTASEEPIDVFQGDLLLVIDLDFGHNDVRCRNFERFRDVGAEVWHVVHDLLPVQLPQYFSERDSSRFADWLDVVRSCDGAVCVSEATADSLRVWFTEHETPGKRLPRIRRFHLGADIRSSVPTSGLPTDAAELLIKLGERPTFLMVGTVEPRKGYTQTLKAFEQLWADKVQANLVIVGKEGWHVKPLSKKLRTHPEKSNRLFWLGGISDEYLEQIYQTSDCLIAASEGEGFGLPLIEAAQHHLPILARDIPVFREVAGAHATYFDGLEPEPLAHAVRDWLSVHASGQIIRSDAMSWLTWDQSAAMLLEKIGVGITGLSMSVQN